VESDGAPITDSFGTQRARDAIRTRLEISKGDGSILVIQSDTVGRSAYLLREVFVQQGLGVMPVHQRLPLPKVYRVFGVALLVGSSIIWW